MRFAILLFLGLVLMTLEAGGKPATDLEETAGDVDAVDDTFDDTEVNTFYITVTRNCDFNKKK